MICMEAFHGWAGIVDAKVAVSLSAGRWPMIGRYGHGGSPWWIDEKEPMTLSGSRHWVGWNWNELGEKKERHPGPCGSVALHVLTDDRQNPGCRYSRDRNGSWVGPMKAVPSCNVVSFLPTQTLPTRLMVWKWKSHWAANRVALEEVTI